jgi:hypothetical protein
MIEQKSYSSSDALNSYNVAQLQFALADPKCDSISFIHDLSPPATPALIPSESDIDYDSRRMSSSATSAADTDSSMSRGEKRALTPSESPQPKKSRPNIDQNNWDIGTPSTQGGEGKPSGENGIDHSKVQLPSIFTTFEDSYRPEIRRASLPASLHSERSIRHAPYPPTSLRQAYTPANQSSLAAYTFPPTNDESGNEKISNRPKLSAEINFGLVNSYDQPYPSNSSLSNGTTPSSSTFSSSTFSSPMSSEYHRPHGLSAYSENSNWSTSPSGIVRPSSTPGQLSSPPVKYEDSLRHSSFSAPMSQAQMYAGSTRISGQQDRRSMSAGIKSEWSFPSPEFVMPTGAPSYPSTPMSSTTPSISVSASPTRSPPSIPSSTLVDRPRKRGKLPKETTDFLKAWLHRHSDHPYPSEEEKKQLCHATGLSMSQVSNWMINARRRILAPAHRAASGPTTTAPFPPTTRNTSLSNFMDGRRSSMPAADSLQLYHPMTLQSIPNTPAGHHHQSTDYAGSTRHMLGLPSTRHSLSSGSTGGLEYNQSRNMGLYVPGQGPHSAGATQPSSHFMSLPLSAPPTVPTMPFPSHHSSQPQQSQSHQQSVYPAYSGARVSSQSAQQERQQQYYNDERSGPGSGYATPQ